MTGNHNNGQMHVMDKGPPCTAEGKTGNEADTWNSLTSRLHDMAAGEVDDRAANTTVSSPEYGTMKWVITIGPYLLSQEGQLYTNGGTGSMQMASQQCRNDGRQ